jgi:hypothetical protein
MLHEIFKEIRKEDNILEEWKEGHILPYSKITKEGRPVRIWELSRNYASISTRQSSQ